MKLRAKACNNRCFKENITNHRSYRSILKMEVVSKTVEINKKTGPFRAITLIDWVCSGCGYTIPVSEKDIMLISRKSRTPYSEMSKGSIYG